MASWSPACAARRAAISWLLSARSAGWRNVPMGWQKPIRILGRVDRSQEKPARHWAEQRAGLVGGECDGERLMVAARGCR